MTRPARAVAAVALAILAGCREQPAPSGTTPAQQSASTTAAGGDIYLLTALPLLFGEGFALDSARPPVITAIAADHPLKAIDLPSTLPEGAILLAAQPRALPAEELAALEAWVRRGGRLLLLADPMLEWPSERPLGDRLRPPVAFADTGLLDHWGLRLDAADKRGPVMVSGASMVSPGTLVASPGSECRVADGIADCTIGKGRAIVVADADWVNGSDDAAVVASTALLRRLLARLAAR